MPAPFLFLKQPCGVGPLFLLRKENDKASFHFFFFSEPVVEMSVRVWLILKFMYLSSKAALLHRERRMRLEGLAALKYL